MFGIGMPELIIILIIALIIFGPKKLPQMGKALGRAMKEFKKTSQELKEEIEFDDIQESLKIEEEKPNRKE
jgi:TatA/E family protein of Tat protein translocase